LADFKNIPNDDDNPPPRHIVPETIGHTQPWDFFDGSAKEAGGGGGAILYLSDSHHFQIQMGLGGGTNNYA